MRMKIKYLRTLLRFLKIAYEKEDKYYKEAL